jgi:lipid II:glycine glycyltransferase (peptidoglycan interpeptide bridge formation enzyme)
VKSHPQGSVFHTPSWLRALQQTYGYEPFALTTSAPDQSLKNGLVFCQIKSFLTGSRIVSLPFSDHCQPLVDTGEDLQQMLETLKTKFRFRQGEYLEIRPLGSAAEFGLANGETFWFHQLNLQPGENDIYKGFHKSCVQRKINRAERDGVTTQQGRSEDLLNAFYHLLLLTRRRHQLPPQPLRWFRNLIEFFSDNLQIRVAFKDGRPIASMLTLTDGKNVVYKYGCSDARFHNSGAMPFLFWQAIQEAKRAGAKSFDFGRSEKDNEGLVAFKGHLGGERSELVYQRYPTKQVGKSSSPWRIDIARKAFSMLPDFCLVGAGNLLYRHIG